MLVGAVLDSVVGRTDRHRAWATNSPTGRNGTGLRPLDPARTVLHLVSTRLYPIEVHPMTLPTTIVDSDSIDHTRAVWNHLHIHGLPAKRLVDPAMIEPEHIEADDLDLRLVSWDSGPTEHPVDADALTDDCHYDPASAGVVFGTRNAVQPIGFATDGPVNTDSVDDVTVFAFGGRDYPDLDVDTVLEAFDCIQYHTPLRRETVDAWAEAFGIDNPIGYWEMDAHGEWTRADSVPKRFVGAIDGLETQSSDSGIMGKKKTARQEFYRNLDELAKFGEVAHA